MNARLNYQGNAVAAKFAKYLISAGKVVSDSGLPAGRGYRSNSTSPAARCVRTGTTAARPCKPDHARGCT